MAVTWKKLAYDSEVVKHSLATAANDFLVASGAGAFVKKTLAEIAALLGSGPVAPAFSAHKNDVNQTIPHGVWTKVTFSTEEFDTNNNFAGSTFTPTVAGLYQLTGLVALDSLTDGCWFGISIWKNGAAYKYAFLPIGAAKTTGCSLTFPCSANGSTDYFEIYCYQDSGGDKIAIGATTHTAFAGARIGAIS